MNEAQLIELVLTAVAGPAAATVVALLCLVGFGWFMIKHMLPNQQKIMDEFIKEGRANRKVFVDAVEVMSRRLDKVEDAVGELRTDVQIIKDRM
jgi:hypothetical protein